MAQDSLCVTKLGDFSMIRIAKQAGKLLLLGLLWGGAAGMACAAVPINVPTKTQKETKPAPSADDKTVSAGEFWDGLTGSLGKLVPSFGSAATGAKDDQKAAEEPKMIKAKRLDGEAPSKAEAAKPEAAKNTAPPPYKVYNAPMVAPDPVPEAGAATSNMPAIYSTGRGATYDAPRYDTPRYDAPRRTVYDEPVGAGYDPLTGSNQPIDTTKPPPLPTTVKRDLGLPVSPQSAMPSAMSSAMPSASSSLGTALARIPEVRQPARAATSSSGEVPPISALPKQFFPIFPAGADSSTLPQLLPVASSAELEADHAATMRAIIYIHDMSRNAAEGVATLMTLMGPDRDSTLIIAPQFPLSIDVMRFADHLPDQGRGIARWPVETGWHTGLDSVAPQGQKGISSFSAVDLLLLLLSDRRRFPSLQEIVVVGHGMGADFVQRYAAMGQAPTVLEKDRLPVRFVVANPASYLYFTNSRPTEIGTGFNRPDDKDCPTYNSYPYGLNDLPPYARRLGSNAIRMGYPERRIVYLVGDKFVTDNYLDKNCGAILEGKDRTSRGRAYERHILQSFGEATIRTQSFAVVANAGLDPVALFGSRCGIAALFGDGTCPNATRAGY